MTSQLGEQANPQRSPESATRTSVETSGSCSKTSANELEAVKQSRTKADLLDWADDVAGVSGSLQGTGLSFEDELDSIHLDDPAIAQALATIAQRVPRQETTSREAAAKALLKGARHGRNSRRPKDTPSRYMDSKLCAITQRTLCRLWMLHANRRCTAPARLKSDSA